MRRPPREGLGGQELEMAMMIADGSKTGRADPAFPAHTNVVHHWALVVWNEWVPTPTLQVCLNYARTRTDRAKQPWSAANGPASALLLTVKRVGWEVVSATELISDRGKRLNLTVDPPVVIKRAVEAAVRRWRWRNMALTHPSLHETGSNFDPIHKLLSSKQNSDDWNPHLRAMLRSVVANRQFPQTRCFQAVRRRSHGGQVGSRQR